MSYRDFQAQPILDINTNGVNMVYDILNSKDNAWLTQGTDAVQRWACAGANGYFSAVAQHLQGEDKEYLDNHSKSLNVICSAVAEFVNKEYDVKIQRSIQRERTVYVDVPYEVKVGLFKKETRYRKEPRTETYYENDITVYKGWLIERLYRQEGNGSYAEVLFFDYCLGADGNLYLLISKKDDPTNEPLVLNCICYSPAFLNNPYCNIYSSVIAGVVGSLDAIPLDENDSRRNVHLTLDDDYYYNYPIQIDDGHNYPFGFLGGTIVRLINLLDENGKTECCKKYEIMNQFIFPTKANVSQDQRVNSQSANNQQIESNSNDLIKSFDFDSMVSLAANVASREPYTQDESSFLANPESAFLEMFLANRLIAADDLAKRYPDFDKLVKIIIDNQNKGLTAEMLFDERELGTNISKNCQKDDEGSVDSFILLATYTCFLNHNSTYENAISIRNMMIDRLCERPYVQADWKDELLLVALWFSNKNNFQEKVKAKYLEIKDTQEYKEGNKKFNFTSFVKAGYKLISNDRENPDNEFLKNILIHRRKIAENVALRFPEFDRVLQAMDITDEALTHSGDFAGSFVNESNVICDYISESSEILDNQDFLILGAAIMAFMGRFNNPEENDGRLFITRIESIGKEIYTYPRIAMFCAALWYADYKDYKNLIIEMINSADN